MAHLVNKDFAELAADSSNYLTWAMYVKIMLITKTTSIQLKSQIHKPLFQMKPNIPHYISWDTIFTLISRMNIWWKRILEHFGLHSKNTMINKRQSFCPKQDESGLYFVLWISNLLRNITLPFTRFVPSFVLCDQPRAGHSVLTKPIRFHGSFKNSIPMK